MSRVEISLWSSALRKGNPDRLPELAADLVRARVDVIVTGGTPATLAAKQATRTIPIVFTVAGQVVEKGIVQTLARPGGNATGLTFRRVIRRCFNCSRKL